MKIYYLNDTKTRQYIYIKDLMDMSKVLEPATGNYFDIPLKINQVPFIKVWDGTVLLSGIDFKEEKF